MVSSVSNVPEASNLDFGVQELSHISAAKASNEILLIIVYGFEWVNFRLYLDDCILLAAVELYAVSD